MKEQTNKQEDTKGTNERTNEADGYRATAQLSRQTIPLTLGQRSLIKFAHPGNVRMWHTSDLETGGATTNVLASPAGSAPDFREGSRGQGGPLEAREPVERTAIGRAEQRRGQDTPARTRESDGGRGSEVPHRCHHGDPARFHFFLFAPRSALVAARTGAVGCALIRRGTRDCPTEPSLGQRAPPSSHPRPKGPHHAPRQRRSRCRRPPARPQPYLPSWCCCCCRRCCCDCSGETCQHAAHGQHFPNRDTLQPCLPRITPAPRQQKQPKRLAMSARCLLQHTRGTHINVRRRRASQRVTSNSRSAKHKRAVKIGRPPERWPRRHETQGLARGVATGGRSVWPPRRESCGLLFFFPP